MYFRSTTYLASPAEIKGFGAIDSADLRLWMSQASQIGRDIHPTVIPMV